MFQKAVLFVTVFFVTIVGQAQEVPSPKSHFGFNIGDDYHLATFTQTEAYLKKIASESNKVKMVSIGKTEEGRNHYMMIVSDPDNLKRLAHYKEIAQKLARAESLNDADAAQLAKENPATINPQALERYVDADSLGVDLQKVKQLKTQRLFLMNVMQEVKTLNLLNVSTSKTKHCWKKLLKLKKSLLQIFMLQIMLQMLKVLWNTFQTKLSKTNLQLLKHIKH